MSKSLNDQNMEQHPRDHDRLYMDDLELTLIGATLRNQITTLRSQDLVFEYQKALARNFSRMKHTMSRRSRCEGGTSVPIPST
ncbi:hypothetical protein Syun_001415 [Stephania yunnanensis]|uniref:Uncharacterized protein n=1 Tax=Stephania yunnanensis TaxID=152371 RepID=A0AAP0LGL7_9MAGN